jgi:hypothetical protein
MLFKPRFFFAIFLAIPVADGTQQLVTSTVISVAVASPVVSAARPEKKGKSTKILVESVKEGVVNFIPGEIPVTIA